MEYGDLRIFEAVSRHGSMNRAAQELHTVQSNVTTRIRSLEEELGVQLFDRHPRGVSLTSAGRRVLPFVDRMARVVEDVKAAALDEGEPSGALLLGSLETTAALRLSPLLCSFTRRYPEVRLTLTTGTTRRLVDDVLACRLEGAFVAGPVRHPELHQQFAYQEELVLVTAPDVRTPETLSKRPDLKAIVFQIGCSYRQRLEAVLADLGLVTARPLEFGSLDAILGCVSAGIGVTLLPRGVVDAARRTGEVAIHELPMRRARVQTLFIRRNDGYVSSAMAAFLQEVHRQTAPVV